MGDTYIVRIFLDRPDWRGISAETINRHVGVIGPDVFTPSDRIVWLSAYGEEMLSRGGKETMTMGIEFTACQPGHPVNHVVQNWSSLFGTLPIPRVELDRPPRDGI